MDAHRFALYLARATLRCELEQRHKRMQALRSHVTLGIALNVVAAAWWASQLTSRFDLVWLALLVLSTSAALFGIHRNATAWRSWLAYRAEAERMIDGLEVETIEADAGHRGA